MSRRLAFYVHHHGHGHSARTRALVDALEADVTILTSAPSAHDTFAHDCDVVVLPRDDGASELGTQPPLPDHVHYAPAGVPGLRRRMAGIARVLADTAPALLVVDVSSEVAQFARLMGVPTVVVRQHGARWDAGHRAAYDGAVALLAPFGPGLEEPDVPDRVRRHTWYAGGLGRTWPAGPGGTDRDGLRGRVGRDTVRQRLGWDPTTTGVALVLGRGGGPPGADDVEAAARATPDHRWLVVGDLPNASPLLSSTGWVADPLPWLDAADVVVGSAGHNTVMEASLVGRSFVCIPQHRPFDEQFRKAARLRALDAAEVLDTWPDPAAWPEIVRRARQRPSAPLATVADPTAAGRTARWLEGLADRYTP